MSVQIAWTDAELLDGIAARRDGVFEALVDRYTDRLFTLAWRITASREDAEEVVQDAFVRAHRALYGGYSAARVRELALRAWLSTIVLNAARNRRRGRQPDRSIEELTEAGRPEESSSEPSPLALAERDELAAQIEQALRQLPEPRRAAVVLRMVEGLSYDEAARALGRPAGTVKSDVHRGLRRLRKLLPAGALA